MNKLEKLLRSNKNILTIQDLAVIWGIKERKKLLENIKYYLRTSKLNQIRRGIYSQKADYDPLELAQKITPLSYISFYTALAKYGVIFQYYNEVHSMALESKRFKIKGQKFIYHKIKSEVFFNSLGIEKQANYQMTSRERAICDSLYLKPKLAFDNLTKVNTKKLLEVSRIYNNKRLEKEIKNLIKLKNA